MPDDFYVDLPSWHNFQADNFEKFARQQMADTWATVTQANVPQMAANAWEQHIGSQLPQMLAQVTPPKLPDPVAPVAPTSSGSSLSPSPAGFPAASSPPSSAVGNVLGGIGQAASQITGAAGQAAGSIADMIRQSAIKHGIDPDIALRVAQSEGGLDDPARAGDNGSSFGPFQLHYGNVAGGGNAVAGLGDAFTKATGLDARDPNNVAAAIDFALQNVAQNGWGAFHGAARAGIGAMDGIGQAAQGAAQGAQNVAQGAQDFMQQSASAVLDKAKDFIGQPYVWGGKSPTQGFDCSGLAGYLTTGQPESTTTLYGKSSTISQQDAQPGDLVFYNMNSSDPHMQHVAVYLGNGKILQSGGTQANVNIGDANQAIGSAPEFRRVGPGGAPVQAQMAQQDPALPSPADPPSMGAQISKNMLDQQAASVGSGTSLNPLQQIGDTISSAITSGLSKIFGGDPGQAVRGALDAAGQALPDISQSLPQPAEGSPLARGVAGQQLTPTDQLQAAGQTATLADQATTQATNQLVAANQAHPPLEPLGQAIAASPVGQAYQSDFRKELAPNITEPNHPLNVADTLAAKYGVDQMQLMAHPEIMSPEDRQAYNNSILAIGGLVAPLGAKLDKYGVALEQSPEVQALMRRQYDQYGVEKGFEPPPVTGDLAPAAPQAPANPFALRTEPGPGLIPLSDEDVASHFEDLASRYEANTRRIQELEGIAEGNTLKVERPPWAVGFTNQSLLDIANAHGVSASEPTWWEKVGLVSGSGELRENVGQGNFRAGQTRQTTPTQARAEIQQLIAENDQLASATELPEGATTLYREAPKPVEDLPFAPYTDPYASTAGTVTTGTDQSGAAATTRPAQTGIAAPGETAISTAGQTDPLATAQNNRGLAPNAVRARANAVRRLREAGIGTDIPPAAQDSTDLLQEMLNQAQQRGKSPEQLQQMQQFVDDVKANRVQPEQPTTATAPAPTDDLPAIVQKAKANGVNVGDVEPLVEPPKTWEQRMAEADSPLYASTKRGGINVPNDPMAQGSFEGLGAIDPLSMAPAPLNASTARGGINVPRDPMGQGALPGGLDPLSMAPDPLNARGAPIYEPGRGFDYQKLADLRAQAESRQPDLFGNQVKVKPSTLNKVISLTVNNMFGTATLLGNTVGNAGATVARPIVTAASGHAMDAARDVAAMGAAFSEAWAKAGRTLQTGVRSGAPEQAADTLPGWATPQLRVLGATDEFFRVINAAGGQASELSRLMRENPSLSFSEALAKYQGRLVAAGEDAAARSVFEKGGVGWGQAVADWKNGLLRSDDPRQQALGLIMQAVVPFSRVPDAILTKGIRGLPGVNEAYGATRIAQHLQAGDTYAASREAATTGLLTAANLAVLYQALQGNITGDGPDNATLKAQMMAAHDQNGVPLWQPNSIRVGDRWIDYGFLGPMELHFSAIANVIESLKQEQGQSAPNITADMLNRITRSVGNTWYLRGLGDILGAINDGTTGGQKFGNAVMAIGDRFVWDSALLNEIRQISDPTVRDPQNFLQREANRLPGVNQMVPARPDPTSGDALQRPKDLLAVMARTTGIGQSGPNAAEILSRSDVAIGAAPKQLSVSIGRTPVTIPLNNDEQRQYEQIRGQLIGQMVAPLDADNSFRTAPLFVRQQALKQIIAKATDVADKQMMGRIPDLGDRITRSQQMRLTANAFLP